MIAGVDNSLASNYKHNCTEQPQTVNRLDKHKQC